MSEVKIERIELRNLKVHADMSEETTCYSAEVWVNGEKGFYAQNDGRGGADFFQPVYDERNAAVRERGYALLRSARAYASSLPVYRFRDGYELPMDLELLVCSLIEKADRGKWMARITKCGKRIAFRLASDKAGEVHIFERPDTDAVRSESGACAASLVAYVLSRYPDAVILRHDDEEYKPVHIVSK
jgi:hypothetical protein